MVWRVGVCTLTGFFFKIFADLSTWRGELKSLLALLSILSTKLNCSWAAAPDRSNMHIRRARRWIFWQMAIFFMERLRRYCTNHSRLPFSLPILTCSLSGDDPELWSSSNPFAHLWVFLCRGREACCSASWSVQGSCPKHSNCSCSDSGEWLEPHMRYNVEWSQTTCCLDEYKKTGKRHVKKFVCNKYTSVFNEILGLLKQTENDPELSDAYNEMVKEWAQDGMYACSCLTNTCSGYSA